MKSKNIATSTIFPPTVFLVVSIIYFFPVLHNLHNLGHMDWDQFTFWNAVPRTTILQYQQFPLWNPYSNGGNVMLALPHSPFLSPLFIFVLVLGPVIGLKIQWLFMTWIGMWGMFELCRHLQMKTIARYLPSGVFMLCSHFTLHLSEGHVEWLAMGFIPWLFLFFIRATPFNKFFVLSVCVLVIMILGGGVYATTIGSALIGVYAVLISFQQRKLKPVISLTCVAITACLLSSVKLIPMFQFLAENPRKIISMEKTPVHVLASILLDPHQGSLYHLTKWNYDHGIKFKESLEYGWHEYGAYTGLIPLWLAVMGALFYFKSHWPLIITCLIALWISLGGGVFFNLWAGLHQLPILDSLHVPSRFILAFIFGVSVLSGLGLSKIEHRCIKTYQKVLLGTIVCFVYADLMCVNYPLLKTTFPIKPPTIIREQEFKQRFGHSDIFKHISRSGIYPAFISNSGVLNAYDVVNIPKGDVKLANDDDYIAPAYLARSRKAVPVEYFSPNRLILKVEAKAADQIVLNQNFHKGWSVIKNQTHEDAVPYHGLISTSVPAGRQTITFYYMPASFLTGLWLSVGAFLFFLIIFGKKFTGSFSFKNAKS